MRVGLLGDVHAEDVRLERALARLKNENVDDVLCVGDIADGHGDLSRTCSLLQEHKVTCVAGNHERWVLANTMRTLPLSHSVEQDEVSRVFLESLPATLSFDTHAGTAMLCHGVGDDDMAVLRRDTRGYGLQALPLREHQLNEALSFMLCGHTHERMVRELPGLTVVNAGTLHREFDAGFAIVDFAKCEVQWFRFDGDQLHVCDLEPLPVPRPMR